LLRLDYDRVIKLEIPAIINPATKLVIPAAAERRAGIQKRPCNYWIPAFAGMTRGSLSDGLFNCQVNNLGVVVQRVDTIFTVSSGTRRKNLFIR